jgi:hypothetical protein
MFGLNAKQLLMLLLLIVALFAGSQVIPAYFHAFQFNDFIRQEVKFAVAAKRTTEQIRTRIVDKSKEYKINVGPRDIHITRRGPSFTVELDYVIPIDLRVWRKDWAFHVSESGELFDQ